MSWENTVEKVEVIITDMIKDVENANNCNYTPRYWINKDGEEETLVEYLSDYFETSNFISEYSIEDVTCFTSPGYDCGIISIAYLTIDNLLGHIVIDWETR